jgi:hypothetical protein
VQVSLDDLGKDGWDHANYLRLDSETQHTSPSLSIGSTRSHGSVGQRVSVIRTVPYGPDISTRQSAGEWLL